MLRFCNRSSKHVLLKTLICTKIKIKNRLQIYITQFVPFQPPNSLFSLDKLQQNDLLFWGFMGNEITEKSNKNFFIKLYIFRDRAVKTIFVIFHKNFLKRKPFSDGDLIKDFLVDSAMLICHEEEENEHE